MRDGNFRRRLTVSGEGPMAELAAVYNDVADRNLHLTGQLARVRRVVGREGKLVERMEAGPCEGAWTKAIDDANDLVEDLVRPVSEVGRVLSAVAEGDLTQRMDLRAGAVGGGRALRGEFLRVGRTVNGLVDQLSTFTDEITSLASEVGTRGKLGGQADDRGLSGSWKDLTDSVNTMAHRLTAQVRNIAHVTTAVANGDLSQKVTVHVEGEMLELKNTVNRMVDQLSSFQSEVTRVAREVGTEGQLGGQAKVEGVGGVWKDLTDSVNTMASNLTAQVREIAQVTTAVAHGDLSQQITVTARGEVAQLAETINAMTETLRTFADEVTRAASEVGTEGRLGGQARVQGVSGTWKDLTDSVNNAFRNLTGQVRNIAQVTTAVANGDLTQKVTVDVAGEMLELKNTVNRMVDQLSSFAEQVTRVAREVGIEGRLGGQAEVQDVSGTWKQLTDSVNFMALNLTDQVRGIAQVTTAVARGDLSQKITVPARGEILELKSTINTMVDQLSAFADQVTGVAREVGTEGRLGGQAQVPGVAGVWRELTDSVNGMANNLTDQVRNIAQVATAVARGDLSQKITVEARGEILELKEVLNTMVDQLSSFAEQVTRVAREVGTEGQLGGQAEVRGVSGTWKDLTESVNNMANNLTLQVRNIAEVTTAVARGDLSKKITVPARGEILELVTTVNTMVDQLSSFAEQVTRVAREVGTEGRLGGQAEVRGVSGTWKDLTDNVNLMARNLTGQVRNISTVATAVANGDLTKQVTVEASGEVAQLADAVNTMVTTLSSFADEVTRVAREVGTEGMLGGQARLPGVSGMWRDLTESVNNMASNLTGQVRNIAMVTTAIARGDLTKKIDIEARGEILELKTTINTMVDQLSSFADQVTRVAREVGTEGQLGGQARVRDVAGTWKELTDSVNEMAGNLTRQVRSIARVATAVTRGDHTVRVEAEAAGEILELQDTINTMIGNLRETTMTNKEQDWLKGNLARISNLMQGRRELNDVAELIMSELAPAVSAPHGAFYLAAPSSGKSEVVAGPGEDGNYELRLLSAYGYAADTMPTSFKPGEALIGTAARQRRMISAGRTPEGYLKISSGLGESQPAHVVVIPVLFEDTVLGVVELASFQEFTPIQLDFLSQMAEMIATSVNTISVNTRTEMLLRQSQKLADELKDRSAELERQQQALQASNEQLKDKADQLAETNRDIEVKNSAIEQARQVLEERAEQLALSMRYKSEFLANMSHELRTPLNSLLILAKLLADNAEGNLNGKQVEFAETIHNAGSDLLQLINDILDLSKVEAGKMDVSPTRIALVQLVDYIEASVRPLTAEKNLEFSVRVSPELPATLHTDEQRLLQVLRNLLGNAVKFTEHGSVELVIRPAGRDVPPEIREQVARSGALATPDAPMVAFAVTDTGIGIAPSKMRVIFEAFKQADGTTSRKYGGTGLGLSISREIARLLGGEIHAASEPGRGSTFTLYLPLQPTRLPPPGYGETVGGTLVAEPGTTGAIPALPAGTGQVEEPAGSENGSAGGSAEGESPAPPAPALEPSGIREAAGSAAERAAEQLTLRRRSRFVNGNGRERGEAGNGGPTGSGVDVRPGVSRSAADRGPTFKDQKVLIVDDDVRNVFALTSVLEQRGLRVLYAENGREGIEVLEANEDVVLVLMDIMMPEMDGYATTSAIRRMPQFSGLPIIALTAKAMSGDREKSIESGASDYVTKPVDTDHLLELMRRWMNGEGGPADEAGA
ncbi:HAMP domain-containing protein [Streptomyces alkaliphilus]|uniref:Circadian input-output histidine kinase CikA n=1 Tax=Streptomyces alkaliphilus TaxID=1472722 RepID=A0A7W3TAT7_9ACTN|nr:HAMP domain-containing protein [Streptomyces alkaliphilus]MBB0243383.1 HAMP domain-containing protein [Streptomyces alkaliphilus]